MIESKTYPKGRAVPLTTRVLTADLLDGTHAVHTTEKIEGDDAFVVVGAGNISTGELLTLEQIKERQEANRG